jgi:hypothetical protein
MSTESSSFFDLSSPRGESLRNISPINHNKGMKGNLASGLLDILWGCGYIFFG